MKNTKIDFSPSEISYIEDTEFLLSKRIITSKVYDLFYQLTEKQKKSAVHQSFKFPRNVDSKAGKITRGENYKGLPFIVLDFPRLFDRQNIFAYRTMFWWGHYFSFTLHLKGPILKRYKKQILQNWKILANSGIHIYCNNEEWNHDLNDKNFQPVDEVDISMLEKILKPGFLKLSSKLNLSDYQSVVIQGDVIYQKFLKLLR